MSEYAETYGDGMNDTLQAALLASIKSNGKSLAFISREESISYEQVLQKVNAQYSCYKMNGIKRIALYCGNSIDFCIQLLTALLYLDVVYIFSPAWEESTVISICAENGINLAVKDSGQISISMDSFRPEQEDIKVVLFTSGTTHTPKGVMLSGDNLLSNAAAAVDCMQYTCNDRLLVSKPLYHSYGLTIEFLAGFLAGASLYLYSCIFSVSRIERILKSQEITVWCTIPSLLTLYIRNAANNAYDLRIIAVGGARCPSSLMEKAKVFFQSVIIVQLYGLTEAGPLVTCTPYNVKAKAQNSIGYPVKGVELELRDKEDRLIVTPGERGELVVKSKGVMKGYLNNEAATIKAVKNGRLYTGDIAYFDDEKLFYFLDRSDSMITRDGINYICAETENVIRSIDGVKEAAVFGVDSELHSQIAIACVECSQELAVEKIFWECTVHRVLPPDKVFFLEKLPLNENGKIDIQKIKKEYADNSVVQVGHE